MINLHKSKWSNRLLGSFLNYREAVCGRWGGGSWIKRLLTCWFAEFNLLTSFLMRGSEVMTQSGKVKGKSSKDSQTGGRSVSSILSQPWKFISTHVHTEQTNSNLRENFIKICKDYCKNNKEWPRGSKTRSWLLCFLTLPQMQDKDQALECSVEPL